MARSLNRVEIIGNMAFKPELKDDGRAKRATFIVITDREWTNEKGEKNKEATKHICIAWDKLAEICVSILDKSDLVYISGRIQLHKFTNSEGKEQEEFNIVVNDMIVLNKFRVAREEEKHE